MLLHYIHSLSCCLPVTVSFNILYVYMTCVLYFLLNLVVIWQKSHQPLLCFALIADPNTLFRSNSLSSKAMEQFMKVCVCFTSSQVVSN